MEMFARSAPETYKPPNQRTPITFPEDETLTSARTPARASRWWSIATSLRSELAGVATTVARVTGIALVALGVACWPGTPLLGMLTYSAGAKLAAGVRVPEFG
jgi:hypothetical protein